MQDRTKNHDALIRRLANYSVIGLFALALLTTLQIASDIVVPIFSALVIGAILTRITDRLIAWGLKPAVAAFCVGAAATALGVLIINALIDPFSAFVAQAPKMTSAVPEMAEPILHPLANLRHALFQTAAPESQALSIGNETDWIAAFLSRLTPALGGLLVFFASLAFFVAGHPALRRQLILAMPAHASRLKALRAFDAVENALALYFGATALIYAAVGVATAFVAFAFGLSNPILWAVMTFVAAYIPYFGVALVTLSLAATNLLTHPHSAFVLAPALIYLAIHEGADLFAIPTLFGRRYEINPFLVFLSIVFWSWMWGPVGALLAVPLLVTLQSLISVLSDGDGRLP
ncbi:AI-2E family transporter [Rhodoblastus acidophilus]|nr:AI-2E family transporter [Rhodoblastus acidophilus]